ASCRLNRHPCHAKPKTKTFPSQAARDLNRTGGRCYGDASVRRIRAAERSARVADCAGEVARARYALRAAARRRARASRSGLRQDHVSGVFVTGLDPDFAAENVGYFTAPYEVRHKLGKPVIDRAEKAVHVTLPNGVRPPAKSLGSQGCVTLPVGNVSISRPPRKDDAYSLHPARISRRADVGPVRLIPFRPEEIRSLRFKALRIALVAAGGPGPGPPGRCRSGSGL